ncbi:MAG: hypothetical protein AAFZ02_06605 [Pseudomonadota bacterium]
MAKIAFASLTIVLLFGTSVLLLEQYPESTRDLLDWITELERELGLHGHPH